MASKVLLAVVAIVLGYLWLVYVKRGPVYESGKSLQGKTVVITGGNTGIGKATVIELAKRNARIVMASRNVQKSETTKNEIVQLTGNTEIIVMKLDLGNQDSVRSFVKKFKEKESNIDYLINNAGILYVNGTTKNGVCNTFNVNHLGHFLLTNLLLDMMKSQAEKRPVRIINLSAEAYRFGSMSKESIYLNAQSATDMWRAYGNSKLANIFFTFELDKRFKENGVTSYAVHPGAIHTEIGDHLPLLWKSVLAIPGYFFIRDPFYGAQTTLYCVLDDDVVNFSGGYFSNCAHTHLMSFAKNRTEAEYLWKESLKLTGLISHEN